MHIQRKNFITHSLPSWRLLLPIFIVAALFFSGGKVHAVATAYQTQATGDCSTQPKNIKLDIKPYTKSGKTYYCMSWTADGDIKSTATQPCPKPDAPSGNSGFGPFCFPGSILVKETIARDAAGEFGSSDNSTAIYDDINAISNFLAAGVGVIVTIMIVVAGIQYAASGGDPQATASAKKKIMNAIIALIAFGLTYAALQFLVPGGAF